MVNGDIQKYLPRRYLSSEYFEQLETLKGINLSGVDRFQAVSLQSSFIDRAKVGKIELGRKDEYPILRLFCKIYHSNGQNRVKWRDKDLSENIRYQYENLRYWYSLGITSIKPIDFFDMKIQDENFAGSENKVAGLITDYKPGSTFDLYISLLQQTIDRIKKDLSSPFLLERKQSQYESDL